MPYFTENQKKSATAVSQPMVDGMTELFEWLESDDGIDHYADKYSIGDIISKDAPFKIALVELLAIAATQGIDIKRLIQSSVIKFYFEHHLYGEDNEKLKFIFDDYLS